MRSILSSPDQPQSFEQQSTLTKVLRNPFFRLLAFFLLSGVVGMPIALASGGLSDTAQTAVVSILTALITYWLVAWLCEGRRVPFELAPLRSWQLLAGLIVGGALFLICVGTTVPFAEVHLTRTESIDWSLWRDRLISSVITAGIAEEIITRGVIYRFLESVLGTWLAVVISGAVFGALHLGNENATAWSAVAIALTAGVFFGLLYALTRSLWLVIGVHAAWNAMQGVILGMPVSGNTTVGIWTTSLAGHEAVTGGAFGIEASVLTVLVFAVVTAVLVWQVHRTNMAFGPKWLVKER
ncbi:CAAX amino terminal protease self- immunity [Corynebacterium kalinowskii]|uniref:CAAX amino terminal protease self- immunity n=2 Tax=Corynebacterium kalinowskii TaxID=2675216 RepID=A0A6B8VRN4_9CORY|nr:CAAX amino terminal protease self- immunity [Corynebacterium kalinowskii]